MLAIDFEKHPLEVPESISQVVVQVHSLRANFTPLENNGRLSVRHNFLAVFYKITWTSHILRILENENYDGQFCDFDAVLGILFGLFLTVIDKLSESKFLRDT